MRALLTIWSSQKTAIPDLPSSGLQHLSLIHPRNGQAFHRPNEVFTYFE